MSRSELSETYDRLMNIVGQLLGLNEEERGFILDRVAPMPEQSAKRSRKKAGKKASKKAGSKSPRASSLGTAIKGNLDQRREAATKDITDESGVVGGCVQCGMAEDMPVHNEKGGYVTWHQFQPAASAAHGAGGD